MELVGRLGPQGLAALPEGIERPRYARDDLRIGIVHLGLGAFVRAHLAVATEAALNAGAPLDWGLCGVSLRSPETRDALAPQQGLYTVAVRDAGPRGAPRQALQVVGCLRELLVAPDDPDAVLARIAHPQTRIVSMTVTEKAYGHDPATGGLCIDDVVVAHDLGAPDAPAGVLGFAVHGLARRRACGLGPLTLLSLDNLPANGHLLRGLVLAFAQRVDPALADWIEGHCRFPCSMVDRIVPRTTEADRAGVDAALGVHDAWPVLAEPFFDWVVEDRFAAGRPDWSAPGVRFVEDAGAWERLKLRMVNGAHSAIAYLGAQAGWRTVDAAIAQPALRRCIERLMREEIEPTLPALPGLSLDDYRTRLLQRFANPALAHRTRQIAMDGSQKLPQRLLGTVRERLAAGRGVERLALAVAAWIHDLRGVDETGAAYGIDDPLAAQLQALLRGCTTAAEAGEATRRICGFAPVFGHDLGRDPRWLDALTAQLRGLREHGVAAWLEQTSP